MPIRINLLAEMQAIEEQRRRDPVKRAILVGVALLALMMVWVTSLMVKKIAVNGEISNLESQIQLRTKDYKTVLDNQQSLVNGRKKLQALNQLTTNRFLMGNVLESLQKCPVDNVQLIHLRVDQAYIYTEGTKSSTNEDTGRLSPGKPSSETEKILITLNAKDTGPVPGDAIGHYQTVLSRNPFLHSLIASRTNDFRLTTSLVPQSDTDGKTFVPFTLEARLPDKTR